jgi:hypothetical protein
MKKAIKINVENKTIEEIEISDGINSISKEIGNNCQYFCCPFIFDNMDSIYADDEALLRIDDIKGGFKMENWAYPLVGNAIILGTDDEGDSINYKSDINEFRKKLIFVDAEESKNWAHKVMSGEPKIFTF